MGQDLEDALARSAEEDAEGEPPLRPVQPSTLSRLGLRSAHS